MFEIINKLSGLKIGNSRQVNFKIDPPSTWNRRVSVSNKVSCPIFISGIKIQGYTAWREEVEYRLMISNDNDVSNVNNPTGEDIIEVIGDYWGFLGPLIWLGAYIPVNKFYLNPPYYFKLLQYSYGDPHGIRRTFIIIFREVWL